MRKILNTFLLFNFIILLNSCETVYFDSPQPIDGKSLTKFPKAYRGVWGIDNDTMIIDNSSIKQLQYKVEKFHVQDFLNSTDWVKSNEYAYHFIDNKIHTKGTYKTTGDSITITILDDVEEHTIGPKLILKKVGGYLILNVQDENNMWNTIYLEKTKSKSIIFKLLNNDKLVELIGKERLNEIQPKFIDTLNNSAKDYYYNCQLTKSEMIMLIDNNAFRDTLTELTNEHYWKSAFTGY